MIRVTLELVSARGAERDRVLGVAYLANTGVETSPGKYGYTLWLSKTIPGQTDKSWKTGRAAITGDDQQLLLQPPDGKVESFDNVTRGAWDLLFCALRSVIGARNPQQR